MSEIWKRDLQDGITLRSVVTAMAGTLFKLDQTARLGDDENQIRGLEDGLSLLAEDLVGRHDGNVPPLEDARGRVLVAPHPNGSVSVEIWRGGQCIIQRTIDRPDGGQTDIGQARAMAKAVLDQCQQIESVPAGPGFASALQSARAKVAEKSDAFYEFVVEHEPEFQRPSRVEHALRAWLRGDRSNRARLLAILHLPEISEAAVRSRPAWATGGS